MSHNAIYIKQNCLRERNSSMGNKVTYKWTSRISGPPSGSSFIYELFGSKLGTPART